MKVVLFESISGLGNRGDVVDVSDGYARNSLIPKGSAQIATAGVVAQAEKMKRAWQAHNVKAREAAEEAAKQLVNKPIRVGARVGKEGKLFGSVTSADIAAAITDQSGIEVDRKMIELEDSIRVAGEHSIVLKPHEEVQFPVNIVVEAQ